MFARHCSLTWAHAQNYKDVKRMGDSVKWVRERFTSRGPWQIRRKKREREREEKLKQSCCMLFYRWCKKKGCYMNVRMHKVLGSNFYTQHWSSSDYCLCQCQQKRNASQSLWKTIWEWHAKSKTYGEWPSSNLQAKFMSIVSLMKDI